VLSAIRCGYFQRAFGLSAPIGALAGLAGLGGGEFRLPVLMRVIGFPARSAVPLNLVVSLATLAFALAARNHAAPAAAALAHLPEVAGLLAGGVLSASFGARLVARISDRRLTVAIAVLLALLGLLLIAEAFASFEWALIGSTSPVTRVLAGAAIGIGVGVVSSMLGVAGGELLIPALVFVFGADIFTAGTASILISLAIVATGVYRHRRAGTLPAHAGARRIATAMIAGSLVGAGIGGLLVAVAPAAALKAFLGLVLIAAAVQSAAGHDRAKPTSPRSS
jgi:uncharacterized membrane protein YfcA